MPSTRDVRRLLPKLALALALCGILLAACASSVGGTDSAVGTSAPSATTSTAEMAPAETATEAPTATVAPSATPEPPTAMPTTQPLAVGVSPDVPAVYVQALAAALAQAGETSTAAGPQSAQVVSATESADVQVGWVKLAEAEEMHEAILAQRFYAVVAPFSTVTDDITSDELRARWSGAGAGPLLVAEQAAADLEVLLGPCQAQVVAADELLADLERTPDAFGVLAFDQLDPRFKVLAVDGVNVLSNTLQPTDYVLAVALVADGAGLEALLPALQAAVLPATNRDATRLTTFIMTGVTAMTRVTAARMEEHGYTYPAEIIAPVLRAADITHVSNEVPFISGCPVNTTEDNLIMCSDYAYWAALEAIGTDIVGLSGNHVNDYGRDGARESLQFYRDRDIPIYGSGLNNEEACAPLLWEHDGNTFAFLAALAYEPSYAWATDSEPGACYYYQNKESILAKVAELAQQVDIVSVELQYEETYNPFPTDRQVEEFRELRQAGADIVTGVQSHVPQAMEPYGNQDAGGPGIIVYGLGNLFFDQMWSWETRTELMARHTIYAGRVISTEILTAVLEDYAQPRWATSDERTEMLERIFGGAPPRP